LLVEELSDIPRLDRLKKIGHRPKIQLPPMCVITLQLGADDTPGSTHSQEERLAALRLAR
jgi:hypothetical protein